MVSYDGQRTNGPGALVTPLRSPTLGKESALYVVNHPKATPRCGSQLHGGPRTLHSMRLPEPAPWAGATVESWTTREGRPHQGPCPALLDPRTVDVRVSLPACEIYVMGGFGLISNLPTPG